MRGIADLAAETRALGGRREPASGGQGRRARAHARLARRVLRALGEGWEFQALLKARPLAGDRELGERYVAAVAPFVWVVEASGNFVESVQRMRERVTANIPADEVDIQLKLGPGGLRDVEFTIQLLQLVHGQDDASVRERSTLGRWTPSPRQGYIGRVEAAEFGRDYRFLRLLEHRMQLRACAART